MLLSGEIKQILTQRALMTFTTTSKLLNKKSANIQVSTVSTPVSTVSTHDNTANISDATMYAFLANQPNGSQLVHEDLEQIHKNDLEEIDLKWQLALLSMRAKRSLRNQESMPRNQASSRKTVTMEDTSSKAMVAIDGASFDWSYMADDEAPTNMALMAFSDSEVQNSKTCSNTCLKSFETLKTQYDKLRIEFNKSEFDLATYKRGIASVEKQLVFYKKNEVMFCDQIAVLKRDASFRDSKINAFNLQIEKLKKEKESSHIKINNFKNVSKSLDKLIGSQISDNSRTGLRFASYNAVAPPPTSLFAPPSIDLSNSGLEEFQHPEFKGYGPKDSKSVCVDTSNEIKKAPDAPIIKDWVSDSNEDESEVMELKFNLFSVSQMYDKKNNVLFTDNECIVLSSDFKLLDENHMFLRVPRENNMYNVDLKNVVPSGDLTCPFAKATLDESNLWHRRLGHINFKTVNKLVKCNLVKGLPSKIFENNHTCVACKKGKKHGASFVARNQPNHSAGIKENLDADTDVAFDVKENENKVYVSLSSSNQPKKHVEKAKREAKGKSHVDLSIRVRDLRDEFEEFLVNSTNRVNAASAPIIAVGPNLTNITTSFNDFGPSFNAVSLNFEIGGKYSFVDTSHYPDDPNMPALEDIVYSDDEEDVGAEADFSN
nr:ribonuclease H-like domain-containing protein [Tanacetum cinerariifolium]